MRKIVQPFAGDYAWGWRVRTGKGKQVANHLASKQADGSKRPWAYG
jgi:hypothetical protein